MKQLKFILLIIPARILILTLAVLALAVAGNLALFFFLVIVFLRLIGKAIQADRICTWAWKRTTTFKF